MNVMLVTSWNVPCGIAEHSSMLKDAVEAVDPTIRFHLAENKAEPLHPDMAMRILITGGVDLVHLNYHAALHSLYTPAILKVMQTYAKILITYHDTGVPNSPQCHALYDVADGFVVHEPAEDLPKAIYWRMGVATPPADRYQYREFSDPRWKLWADQPVLGTIGFPFPWKCYDELAKITHTWGWAFYLIAPGATPDDVAHWKSINPQTFVHPEFMDRVHVVRRLHWCDATAFTYVCHNTGQSGAILQGIATAKPVIALSSCRQFRALYDDPLGRETIRWCDNFADVGWQLRHLPIERVDGGIVALGAQENWRRLARKYAGLYHELMS